MQPQLIVLDGQILDWGGIAPFVPGAAGGPSAPKFTNVYLFADTDNLWFRFDAKLGGTAPVAGDDTYSVRQGKSLNVAAPGVLVNDSDPNGATLTPSVVSTPQHGTVSLDPSGSFIYSNNGASAPVDTFTYHDTSTSGTSNTANVTINVTPDHKPVANPDNYNVGHGGTLTVPAATGVLANDTDADGDNLTAHLASGPQHGTLNLALNGSFVYTHDGSNVVQDTFTYRASDGVLNSANALVTITIGPVAPAITSVNNAHFTASTPGTFTVTTTGFPPPAISETGALPSGVTLVDNGNGTATLAGTPAGGSGGVYPIVLHATNTGGTANQNFTLTVCNVITVTNPATNTGTAGTAFSQTFTQSGAVGTPTFTTARALPAGLT
jgi:VCBS repeat-containing protein